MGKWFIIAPFGLIDDSCVGKDIPVFINMSSMILLYIALLSLEVFEMFSVVLKGIISVTTKIVRYLSKIVRYASYMAIIYNTPADCRIWHPTAGSQILQVPISASREIILQEEHLCCQKIVICSFNGVLKCNDPRWSSVEKKKTLEQA